MFGFNINRPTDLQSIEGALSSYATPEAAVADFDANAPRGRDYLTDQYQKLTGDYFADPFSDLFKGRNEEMMQAAMGGASVATGSNTGMRLLSRPIIPATTSATGSTPGVLPLPNFSPSANREVSNSLMTQMLQAKGRDYQLSGSYSQIPTPDNPDYLKVLQHRANLAGVGNEFGRINPRLLTSPIDDTDPRFARTQAGKAIGMDIHPLAYDEGFQEIARRDPGKATALYHAVTNRDYDTDVKAKSQLLVEQRDARKKIIEGIKNLEADPVSGDLYKVVERRDFDGSIKQERVPITPLEKAAVDAEGGAKRIYGIELPNRGGLPRLPGMNDTEMVQYRAKTQQLMKEKGLNVQEASALAHRMMYSDQQARNTPVAPQRRGFQRTLEALSDLNISGANIIPRLLNELLSKTGHDLGTNSSEPIPLIPHPDWNRMAENDVPIMDILREGLNAARGLPAGRTYRNRPVVSQ